MTRSLLLIVFLCCSWLSQSVAQSVEIHVRVVNGKNGRAITNEKLNVFENGTHFASIMPTNEDGAIVIQLPQTGTLAVQSNEYMTCHPYRKGDSIRVYSVGKILKDGVVDDNMCGKRTVEPHPGELVVFERPFTWLELFRL